RLDKLGLFARGVAGAVLAEDEAADAMATEVVGDGVAAPGLGQVAAAEDFQPAVFRAAGVETGQGARRANGPYVPRARHQVVDAFAVGPVGHELLSPVVKVVPPRINEATGKHFQPVCLRPKLPDAAAVEPADAVWGFDVAVDVHGLV